MEGCKSPGGSNPSLLVITKEKQMLTWDISYPDTFKCNLVGMNEIEIKFTIHKKLNNKYDVYVRIKVGDEFFEQNNYDFETLQKANTMSEEIYERMNRK